MLTKQQERVLKLINSSIAEKGASPTLEELSKKLRIKATSTVAQHIDTLVDKGYLVKKKNIPRSLKPTGKNYLSLRELELIKTMDEEAKQKSKDSVASKSYLSKNINKLIKGDCVEIMRKLPDSSIDLMIADPPYNLSKGTKINFKGQSLAGSGGDWNKVMQEWDNMPLEQYLHFTFSWLREAKRIMKPTGSIWVFGTYHNIGIINTVFQLLEIEIINEVIWYKRNSFPNLAGRRLTASHETLLWGHNSAKKRMYKFNYDLSKKFHDKSDLLKPAGKQMRTVWDIPNNKSKSELAFGKHPTQKPEKVCDRIVQLTTDRNDIVLAPFTGAGTECVSAKKNNRRYIGIDTDANYLKVAKTRLQNLITQQELL